MLQEFCKMLSTTSGRLTWYQLSTCWYHYTSTCAIYQYACCYLYKETNSKAVEYYFHSSNNRWRILTHITLLYDITVTYRISYISFSFCCEVIIHKQQHTELRQFSIYCTPVSRFHFTQNIMLVLPL